MKFFIYARLSILSIYILVIGNISHAQADNFTWKKLRTETNGWECIYNLENNTAFAHHPRWGSVTGTFEWIYDEENHELRINYTNVQNKEGYPDSLSSCNFYVQPEGKVKGSCTNAWDVVGYLYN